MQFNERLVDGHLTVFMRVDNKPVGFYRIDTRDMDNSRTVHGKIKIFNKGKGYSRPLIEYVIGILAEKKVVYCVYLTSEESEQKLTHIFKENGYTEEAGTFLLRDYSK